MGNLFEKLLGLVQKKNVGKMEGCYARFRNDPKHPVRIESCFVDDETETVRMRFSGHAKERTFDINEVDAILARLDDGRIVSFNRRD